MPSRPGQPARPRGGRKRKPPALKVIEGNPGKGRIEPGVDLPPVTPPEPAWTTILPASDVDGGAVIRDASVAWRRVVSVLDGSGVLALVDAFALTDFAVCWARLLQAERAMSLDGVTVVSDRGAVVKHPSLTAANQYRAQLRFLVSELGLTPAARARIHVPVDDAGPDPAADLLD